MHDGTDEPGELDRGPGEAGTATLPGTEGLCPSDAPNSPDDPGTLEAIRGSERTASTSIAWLADASNRVVPFVASPDFEATNAIVEGWMGSVVADGQRAGTGLVGWVAVSGGAGSGKTRFAVELLVGLQDRAEFPLVASGLIRCASIAAELPDRQAVAQIAGRAGAVGLVLDEVGAVPAILLAEVVEGLAARPAGTGPFVLIVTSRVVESGWWDVLQTNLGPPLAAVNMDGPGPPEGRRQDIDAAARSAVATRRRVATGPTSGRPALRDPYRRGPQVDDSSGVRDVPDTPTGVRYDRRLAVDTSGPVDPHEVFAGALSHFVTPGERGHDLPDAPRSVAAMTPLQATLTAALVREDIRPGDPGRVLDPALNRQLDDWVSGAGQADPDAQVRADLAEALAVGSLCRPRRTFAAMGEGIWPTFHTIRAVLETSFTNDSERFAPVRPDPLADRLIASTLARRPDQLWSILNVLLRDPESLETFCVTVDRVWSSAEVPEWVDDVLDGLLVAPETESSTAAITTAALGRFRPTCVVRWAIHALDGSPHADELARAVLATPGLARTASEVVIAAGEHLLTTDPDSVERGRILARLADAYDTGGDTEHAIELGDDAVAMLRKRGTATPVDAEGGEAVAVLTRHAERLERTPTRAGEATELYDEAVGIARVEFSEQTDPGAESMRRFAKLLVDHAVRLGEVPGRFTDAIEIGAEALVVLGALGDVDPAPRSGAALVEATDAQADRLAQLPSRLGEAVDLGAGGIAVARTVARADPRYRTGLAAIMDAQARRLARSDSRLGEAIGLADQAIAVHRALAGSGDAPFAALAGALNEQAERISRVPGRLDEAVALGSEAIDSWRTLADVDPAYLDALARTLRDQADRLGGRFGGVGTGGVGTGGADAVAFGDEAIAIMWPLAKSDPRHRATLAAVLGSQAARLDGHPERNRDASSLGHEAVRILRTLAGENPRHRIGLARALDAQAQRMTVTADHPGAAIELGEEAVAVFRLLAESDQRYPGEFVGALARQAARLDASPGRAAEAIALDDEAIRIGREVAAIDPASRPAFVHSLEGQAARLERNRMRPDDVITLGDETVAACRVLAAADPRCIPDFARVLRQQALRLDRVPERAADALALGSEFIGVARTQLVANPDVAPGLVRGLDAQADRLARRPDGVEAAVGLGDEAVSIARSVATADVAQLGLLAACLGTQAVRVAQVPGRTDDGVALGDEAIALYRRVVVRDPRQRGGLAWVMETQAARKDALKDRKAARVLRGAAAELRR